MTEYNASLNGTVWSVTIPLASGANSIWVKAMPTDTDCSPVQRDLMITRVENGITTCTETSLNPTSVVLNNGFFTITCH